MVQIRGLGELVSLPTVINFLELVPFRFAQGNATNVTMPEWEFLLAVRVYLINDRHLVIKALFETLRIDLCQTSAFLSNSSV